MKSVILCVRTHHYKATVNVLVKNRRTLKRKGSEGDLSASQVESMPLDEMRELLPEEFKNEVEEDPENDGLNEIGVWRVSLGELCARALTPHRTAQMSPKRRLRPARRSASRLPADSSHCAWQTCNQARTRFKWS